MSAATMDLPREIVFDRERFRAQVAVSDREMALYSDAEIRRFEDHTAKRLVYQLESEVLTHKVAESTCRTRVPYPATWVQHFNHQHRDNRLVAWWNGRHPVRFTNKEAVFGFSKKLRFPESTIRFPRDLGRPVMFEEASVSLYEPAIGPCGPDGER